MDIKENYNLILMDDGTGIVALSPHTSLEEQCVDSIIPDWHKRYRYKVGTKVVNPWGIIETISEVIHHEETKTTNYLVEECGNCYQPHELHGLFIKKLSADEINKLIL
jgi:hypothetical protein